MRTSEEVKVRIFSPIIQKARWRRGLADLYFLISSFSASAHLLFFRSHTCKPGTCEHKMKVRSPVSAITISIQAGKEKKKGKKKMEYRKKRKTKQYQYAHHKHHEEQVEEYQKEEAHNNGYMISMLFRPNTLSTTVVHHLL